MPLEERASPKKKKKKVIFRLDDLPCPPSLEGITVAQYQIGLGTFVKSPVTGNGGSNYRPHRNTEVDFRQKKLIFQELWGRDINT